jgi:hypothetical protein
MDPVPKHFNYFTLSQELHALPVSFVSDISPLGKSLFVKTLGALALTVLLLL